MIAIGSQRELFDVPDDLVYLNTANMSPLLRSVREAGERALARRAAPWRITADDWFADVERLRELYARVLGADADGVALVPATSYGLAVAAKNLTASRGEQVLVLDDEYPSNYYTWRRFCERTGATLTVVAREPGQAWTDAVLACPGRAANSRFARTTRRMRARGGAAARRSGSGGSRSTRTTRLRGLSGP